MERNKMTACAAIFVALLVLPGCVFESSSFVCSDGETEGERTCENGVWVQRTTGDSGNNDSDVDVNADMGNGDATSGDMSVCVPESDSEFCNRYNKNCESFSEDDNCGDARTVICGVCTNGLTCGGGGVTNACGEPGDQQLCEDAGAQCGTIMAANQREVTCMNTCGASAICPDITCECAGDGFEIQNLECVDIDECALQTDTCDDVSEMCVNNDGGFDCPCATGYKPDGNGVCVTDVLVLSTNRVSIPVPDGSASESVDVSALFGNLNNVVPFLTARFPNQNQYSDDMMFAVELNNGNVTVTRGFAGGEAIVNVDMVEFEPTRTRVQSGVLSMTDNAGQATVSLGQNINRDQAFVVFWIRSTEDDRAREDISVSVEVKNDELVFERESTAGQIDGNWWVVESLDASFTVDHIDAGDISNGGGNYASTFDRDDTFVLYSYQSNVRGDADDGHLACFPGPFGTVGANNVGCRRAGGSDDILKLWIQVVSSAQFMVFHGDNELPDTEATTAVVADALRSSVFLGNLGGAGMVRSNQNDGNLWKGMCSLDYDGQIVRVQRGDAGGDSRASWSLVTWP